MKKCKTCAKTLCRENRTGFCAAHFNTIARRPDSRRSRQGVYREDPPGDRPIPALRHPQTSEDPVAPDPIPDAEVDTSLLELVRLTRKGQMPFEELCNRLDVSPAALRDLLDQARALDLAIGLEGGKVGLQTKPSDDVQVADVAPALPGLHTIGCISDTHLGSKWVLRHYLVDFIHHAYAQGARKILHSGDILDGDYHHGKFEMTHMGLDEQTRDLYETLPRLPGLEYFAISGNHDNTLTAQTGVDVPKAISSYFRSRGRADFHALGNRGAMVKVEGALVYLWHPGGSVGYATSYKMQKKIEGFAPGFKPQILQIGHWHRMATIDTRGVFAFAAGTFQGGGSEFSRSLTDGPSAIGGTVLSWTLTKDGTLRDIHYKPRRYFEKETAQAIATTQDEVEALYQEAP